MSEEANSQLAALLAEPGASALLVAIDKAGEQARIVGGAVRNALMKIDISDIDITTTALPRRVMQIAEAQGWKAVPTGIEHGTITVVIAGRPYEVTTLREDISTDGRHAEVRFGQDFRADAARRDFTINAMSVGRDGVLHDEFGGLTDLAARRVRFIGDPDQRLIEDYLRGLRFLRFSATYAEGSLDASGLAAVMRHREGFARLSRERIRGEMFKLVMAPHALDVVREAEAHGLISMIVGLRPDLARFERALGHEAGEQTSPMLKIFALFGASEAAIDALRASLKLTNREHGLVSALSQGLAMHEAGADPRLIAYRCPEAAPHLPLFVEKPIAALPSPPVFTLKGEDIVKTGIRPGPEVGRLMSAIEDDWIAAGLPAGRAAQEAILRRIVRP
ncbi:MAG: CCA tRNA nucleotidyltransferase [Rhabdaerophilum sp.]